MNKTPSSIVSFKNGYSFVCVPINLEEVKESKESEDAAVGTQIRRCHIGPLPDFVVHGTIGLQAEKPDKMKIFSISKVAKELSVAKLTVPPGSFSMATILEANIGKYVLLKCKEKVVHGKVLNVSNVGDEWSFVMLEVQKSKKKKADIFMKTSDICNVEASDERDGDVYDNDFSETSNELLVRYHNSDPGSSKVLLSYLTKGLTWAPSYSLSINKDSKTVSMEGKACLLCDIKFLEGDIIPEICLVTGEPKMQYSGINDPLTCDITAEEFARIIPGNSQPQNHHYQTRRAAKMQSYANRGLFGATRSASFDVELGQMESFGADDVAEAEGIGGGESVEDFFHYVLKNVPLKHGHPISLNFIEDVPSIKYEDVYYVNLDDVNDSGEVDVKHAISFKNTTSQPLTTAPATILAKSGENSKFLVQGMMKFTLPGQDATVEITKTLNVQAKFTVETGETTQEMTEAADEKIVTTKKSGSVEILNTKDEDVKCKIEYILHGTMLDSSPLFKNKYEQNSNYSNMDLNTRTKYVWEFQVEAKKKQKVSFNFCIKKRVHVPKN